MVGVLRLLHRKTDQIITGEVDFGGVVASSLPGSSRENRAVHRLVAQLDANFGTVAVDEFAVFFRQTRVTL